MVMRVGKKTGKRLNIMTEKERCGGIECESSDKVLFKKYLIELVHYSVYRTDLDIDCYTISGPFSEFVQSMLGVPIKYIKVSYPVSTKVRPGH
jgi:hypothetical protein